jgi:hypothetical protein
MRCDASELELFAQPGFRRERRVKPPLRAIWARRFECHVSAPLNQVRLAGALGGRVVPDLSGSAESAPAVVRSDAGWCPIHRHEAPDIGDAGRAFPADGAEGPHARGASRHVRARIVGQERDRPSSD